MFGRIRARIREVQNAADRLERLTERQEIVLDQQRALAEHLQPFLHQLVAVQGGNLQPGPAGGYVSPPIFLNTMPKSGSVFIMESLAKALDVPFVPVSPGYFPDDLLSVGAMRRLGLGGAITQSHSPPHPLNMALIRTHVDRFVIHVRDPRQATLSWLHHIEAFKTQPDTLAIQSPPLPDGYFDHDLTARIDWQIDNYLPHLVHWLERWLGADDKGACGVRILFSTYEDFHSDPRAFLAKILAFYEVPEARHALVDLEKTAARNFRKGIVDEWRAVFSSEQARRASAAIPDPICKRFGWRR